MEQPFLSLQKSDDGFCLNIFHSARQKLRAYSQHQRQNKAEIAQKILIPYIFKNPHNQHGQDGSVNQRHCREGSAPQGCQNPVPGSHLSGKSVSGQQRQKDKKHQKIFLQQADQPFCSHDLRRAQGQRQQHSHIRRQIKYAEYRCKPEEKKGQRTDNTNHFNQCSFHSDGMQQAIHFLSCRK